MVARAVTFMGFGRRLLDAVRFWRKPPPPPPRKSGRERRKWPRINLDAEALLTFDRVGPEMRARIVNASAKGLFLAMNRPRPLGTSMRITVKVGEGDLELRVAGVVVHVVETPGPGEVKGVGLVLTEMGDDWSALCARLAEVEAAKPEATQGERSTAKLQAVAADPPAEK